MTLLYYICMERTVNMAASFALDVTRWIEKAKGREDVVVQRCLLVRRLLRARRERPRGRYAAEECDELASSHVEHRSEGKSDRRLEPESQQEDVNGRTRALDSEIAFHIRA